MVTQMREENNMKKVTYYNCFSLNQMKFLITRGEKIVYEKTHSKTGKTFWGFERSNSLDELLSIWSKR